MTFPRTLTLIDGLRQLPAEAAWVGVKWDNTYPLAVGKLIAAMSAVPRITKSLDHVLIRDRFTVSGRSSFPSIARPFAKALGREVLDRVLIGRFCGRFERVFHG